MDFLTTEQLLEMSQEELLVVPTPKKPKDFLESLLLSCPGYVGEIARSIDSHLDYSRPSISLPTALAFVAAIKSGRVVADNKKKTECPLYVISLAPTGFGKTTAQNVLEDLAAKAGIQDLFGLEPTSDTALIKGLSLQPRQLVLWEEFGEALDDLANAKDSPKASVLRAFTNAFSKSGRKLSGKVYASGDKNEAENIYLSVFGVSNEFSFYNALNERFVHNGFLARWLCFVPDKNKPEARDPLCTPVSEGCIDWLRRMDAWSPATGNLAAVFKKEKRVICLSKSQTFRLELKNFTELGEDSKTETERAFWIRSGEIFTKLCLIFTEKHPDEATMEWCSILVQELVSRQIVRCTEFMSGNSEKAKDKSKFIRLLAVGEEITTAKLFQRAYRLSLSRNEKDDMIDMLIDSGCWLDTSRRLTTEATKETSLIKCVRIFRD